MMAFVGYFHACPQPYPFPTCHCGHNQTVTITLSSTGKTETQVLLPCDECEPGEAPVVPEPEFDPETGVYRIYATPVVAPRRRNQ